MKRRPTFAAFASPLLLLSLTTQGNVPLAARTKATTQTLNTQTRQQRPQPSPSPQRQDATPDSEDEVVRITSNLVRIDAVVTDEKGNRVEDLRPEDFEVVVTDALDTGKQAAATQWVDFQIVE